MTVFKLDSKRRFNVYLAFPTLQDLSPKIEPENTEPNYTEVYVIPQSKFKSIYTCKLGVLNCPLMGEAEWYIYSVDELCG
jgi:hypothetical protein